ncbi:L-arabinose transport system permease protein AraQ [compost metagenome]
MVGTSKHAAAKRIGKKAKSAALHAVMIILSLVMIAPFLWMVSTSLKSTNEMYAIPPSWIPTEIMWSNYVYMFESAPWFLYFFNTVKVTGFVVLGQLVICSMAAFGFARLKFPGRNVLFFLLLGTMMIPYHVTMIPTFQILRKLGWLDSHRALIIPALFAAFGVFLLRQFFMTLPKELEQAAMIDGCGYPRIFLNVILPNAKPALTTLAIFTFMGTWNDFLGPLIYLNSDHLKTLTLGLATFQGVYTNQWNYMMAGALIVSLPILFVYMFAQRYFVEGIVMSGLKE